MEKYTRNNFGYTESYDVCRVSWNIANVGVKHQSHDWAIYCYGNVDIKWFSSWFMSALNRDLGYKYLWAEQTFRLFIILTIVISRRKNQWYIVSQLRLEQIIWQSWLLMFLPTKLSVLLKILFFTSLKSTKITSKIQISEVCDIQFHKYAVHINADFWW